MKRRKRDADYVLIVGDSSGSASVQEAIGAVAEVRACPGPGVVPCPAATGATCGLRKNARTSVVYLTNSEDLHSTLPCFAVEGAPAVGVIEGSLLPLHTQDGYALVGSCGGTLAVLEAVAALTEPSAIGAG